MTEAELIEKLPKMHRKISRATITIFRDVEIQGLRIDGLQITIIP